MTSPVSWDEYKRPLSLSVGITALVWFLLFTIVIFDPSRDKQPLLGSISSDSGNVTSQVSPLPLIKSSHACCLKTVQEVQQETFLAWLDKERSVMRHGFMSSSGR